MNQSKAPLVLIVDDNENNVKSLEVRLRRRDFNTIIAYNGNDALTRVEKENPDIVLLDVRMPGMDGYETCQKIKDIAGNNFLPVILVTASDDKSSIVKGLNIGADDYVTKPFDIEELHARIRAMLRIKELQNALHEKNIEVNRLSKELKGKYTLDKLIGHSKAMKEVLDKIEGASMISSPVIISGESGTGKELTARGIHYSGIFADKPFVPINCAALPAELIESELFGHKKGAFTGAMHDSPGLFKTANHGTIFFDEITEMPITTQAKLLRVLEEGKIRPLGKMEETAIDVRVISASNRDLQTALEEGHFREDLYYRLNVINIELPSLRERKEDIPILIQSFIEELNHKFGRKIKGLDDKALEKIMDYSWPGNIRELRNIIEGCYIHAEIEVILSDYIKLPDFTPGQASKKSQFKNKTDDSIKDFPTLKDAGRENEKAMIENALKETGNNKVKAAKLLGIHRSLLYKKIEDYNIK